MNTQITPQLARIIINEALSGGFESEAMPEDEGDLVARGTSWAEAAIESYQSGVKHPTVLAIVNLVDSKQLEQGKTASADVEGEDSNPELTAVAESYPRRSSGGLSESDEREIISYDSIHSLERSIRGQNLPIPEEIEHAPTPMPRDLSELTDKKVRQLSGEYNSYLGRAKWILAVATSDLANATHLRDEAYRQAMKIIARFDDDTGKKKLAAVLDAEAKDDFEYQKFNDGAREHQNRVTAYKALVEIYAGNVDRLSREWTMRQDDYNKSK